MRSLFFFFFLKQSGGGCSGFCSLLCLPPPLSPIKGLSVQPWFINWITRWHYSAYGQHKKKIINSSELRQTRNMPVLTHTHTLTHWCYAHTCLSSLVTVTGDTFIRIPGFASDSYTEINISYMLRLICDRKLTLIRLCFISIYIYATIYTDYVAALEYI